MLTPFFRKFSVFYGEIAFSNNHYYNNYYYYINYIFYVSFLPIKNIEKKFVKKNRILQCN